MTKSRGAVWWGPAPHRGSSSYRPWLIISDGSHPFDEVESIALGMTTRPHPRGIAVPDEAWERGGSKQDSYVSPWYVTTVKGRDFDQLQGTLSASLVETAVDALCSFVGHEC